MNRLFLNIVLAHALFLAQQAHADSRNQVDKSLPSRACNAAACSQAGNSGSHAKGDGLAKPLVKEEDSAAVKARLNYGATTEADGENTSSTKKFGRHGRVSMTKERALK